MLNIVPYALERGREAQMTFDHASKHDSAINAIYTGLVIGVVYLSAVLFFAFSQAG